MCKYCEKEKFENKYANELFKSLPLKDDYTDKSLNPYKEGNPVQYIRKNKAKYKLITELANEDGDVLNIDINYCPMCGRRLGE